MTVPSNANTSGLITDIDAEMEGRQRGYADVRGELLFRCRDRIAELEADLSQANANGASHWSRATAAEARADRLASALDRTKRVLDNTAIINALRMVGAYEILDTALQQETQP